MCVCVCVFLCTCIQCVCVYLCVCISLCMYLCMCMFLHLYCFPVILWLRREKTLRNKGMRRLFITGVCLSVWLVAPQGVFARYGWVQILLPMPTESQGHYNLRLFYHLHPQPLQDHPPIHLWAHQGCGQREHCINMGGLIASGSHWSSYVLNVMSIIHHSEISLQGKHHIKSSQEN